MPGGHRDESAHGGQRDGGESPYPRCGIKLELVTQRSSGCLGIPLHDGVHQVGVPRVAVVRIVGAKAEQLDQIEQPSLQHRYELGEQTGEHRVVGRGDHCLVQGDVGPDELGGAGVRGVTARGQGLVEGGDVVLGPAPRGQLRGLDLDEHPHLVDVRDGRLTESGGPVLPGLGRDDEDPGSLACLHQSRAYQCAQGLANGGARRARQERAGVRHVDQFEDLRHVRRAQRDSSGSGSKRVPGDLAG